MVLCPYCGSELRDTTNPVKLQCTGCGRVFKDFREESYLRRRPTIWSWRDRNE